jgi:hypothetical protein
MSAERGADRPVVSHAAANRCRGVAGVMDVRMSEGALNYQIDYAPGGWTFPSDRPRPETLGAALKVYFNVDCTRLRDELSLMVAYDEQPTLNAHIAAARTHLGDRAFDAHWATGATLTREQLLERVGVLSLEP